MSAAAKTEDREIVITRVFDAPWELVFEVWTDPKHIASWWGPKGFTKHDSRTGSAPKGIRGVDRKVVSPAPRAINRLWSCATAKSGMASPLKSAARMAMPLDGNSQRTGRSKVPSPLPFSTTTMLGSTQTATASRLASPSRSASASCRTVAPTGKVRCCSNRPSPLPRMTSTDAPE